jgi:hypothetical protein
MKKRKSGGSAGLGCPCKKKKKKNSLMGFGRTTPMLGF